MVDTPMGNRFMGLDGFVWWFGIVENRMDPLKVGRAQVRIFGWSNPSQAIQPTNQLQWCHQSMPLNGPTTVVKPPREGTQVWGYFMDGEAAQFPIMIGIMPSIPDQNTDPSHGFSDPRTNDQLQNAPAPPQSVSYPTDGSGAVITNQPALRFPNNLNEPTTSRLGRNENIQDTIVQTKMDNLVTNVPVATGSLEIPGIDLQAALTIALPSIVIPPINVGFTAGLNLEFCGLNIGAFITAGFSFGGLIITPPTITLSGEILIGGINIEAFLAGAIAIADAVAIAIDIAGCILAGLKIGDNIIIDGGISLPLLKAGASLNLGGIGINGIISGGIKLGTVGGIPLASTPMWNEPAVPYNASYPYNYPYETESGHVLEVDDTPGHERIHTYHRSGTFDEMHPNGDRVQKTVKNRYDITYADHGVNVMGNQHITCQDQTNMVQGDRSENVNGSETKLIKGNKTETVMGTEQTTNMKDMTNIIMQNRFLNVKGDDNVVIEGDKHVIIKGDCDITIQGNCTLAVAGKLIIGSTGDTDMTIGGDFNLVVNGNKNETVNGKYQLNIMEDYDIDISGNYTINDSGNYNMTAKNLTYSIQQYTATLPGTYTVTAGHTEITPLPNG